MKTRRLTFVFALLTLLAMLLVTRVHAGGGVGNGTPGSCTEAALDIAPTGGGTVTFNCGDSPVIITVTSEKTFYADTTIDGTGQFVTISGGNAVRVFTVSPYTTLNLKNITVANGSHGRLDIAGGCGAGLLIYSGTANIENTTFTDNSNVESDGAGICSFLESTLTITNSTFANNVVSSTNSSGGALANDAGIVTITNSAFANNSAPYSGGGVYNVGGTVILRNTILANNSGGNCDNYLGTITNGGNNIDSGSTCGFGSANGSMSNTNPLLGSLANNGGPTQTFALQAGSPAIDAGKATYCPATDQRGNSRVGVCDIGAYESQMTVYRLFLPLLLR